MDDVVKLIMDLMRFKTTEDRPEEIKKCSEFICDYLKHASIKLQTHEQKGKLAIVATFDETKKPKLFLNAHFDVVPASDDMFEARIEGNQLYGRGSEDCKAQVAILMKLMRHFADKENKPDVGIMLTSDEEVHGANGVRYLIEELGYGSEFALVADGGSDFDIVTKHKGVMQVKVSAKGKSAHSSTKWQGENAIEGLLTAYIEIQELFPEILAPEWKTTANLSKIAGGDVLNKVPDKAELYLDIRRTEEDSEESILGKLKAVPGIDVEVIASADMLITDENNEYVGKLKKSIETVLKRSAKTSYEHGATDARFFSANGIPAVVFKAEGFGAHSDIEYLDIPSLKPFFDILIGFVESI